MSKTDRIYTIESDIFCRICHDNQGELHKVCNCKGSIGLVHLECQEKWLSLKQNNICDLCGYEFQVILENPKCIEVINFILVSMIFMEIILKKSLHIQCVCSLLKLSVSQKIIVFSNILIFIIFFSGYAARIYPWKAILVITCYYD